MFNQGDSSKSPLASNLPTRDLPGPCQLQHGLGRHMKEPGGALSVEYWIGLFRPLIGYHWDVSSLIYGAILADARGCAADENEP